MYGQRKGKTGGKEAPGIGRQKPVNVQAGHTTSGRDDNEGFQAVGGPQLLHGRYLIHVDIGSSGRKARKEALEECTLPTYLSPCMHTYAVYFLGISSQEAAGR